MSTVERIQQLLDCAVLQPTHDKAGVIIPCGIDASIEARAYKRCLKIAQEEENICIQRRCNESDRTTQEA